MKKFLVLLSMLCMLFIITACGEEQPANEYVGTWNSARVYYSSSYSEDIDASSLYNGTIVINNDGTMTITLNGESVNGKWDHVEGDEDFRFQIEEPVDWAYEYWADPIDKEGWDSYIWMNEDGTLAAEYPGMSGTTLHIDYAKQTEE